MQKKICFKSEDVKYVKSQKKFQRNEGSLITLKNKSGSL